MRKTRLLYLFWILVLIFIAKSNMDERQENTAFQGIVESREVIVNSEKAVEIKKIHVTQGQVIDKGRLLVELERPELTMSINEISHSLEELRLQGGINRDNTRSQIERLKAEKKVINTEADRKISQLQSRLSFNKEVAAGLESISVETQGQKKRSPMETEIENLEEERRLKLSQIQVQIDTLEKHLFSSETPTEVKIESLEKELNLLMAEKKKLLVYAETDGMVGSVLCKVGEKISPFVPIMTIYNQSPGFVRAYIHEKVHHKAQAGEEVEVASLSDTGKRVTAKIVGTGSRIVEYPIRLRKRPEFPVFGREVEISLPEENAFLLGEHVMVYPLENSETMMTTLKKTLSYCLNLYLYAAESDDTNTQERGMLDIRHSKSLGKIPEIEASGLIYLADMNRFLLISDETGDMSPALYLMDEDGMVKDKVLIHGIETIDDMEAICQDDKGNIYIACSQSRKKDGSLPNNRKILAKIQRNGSELHVKTQVYLYDLLKEAARKKTDAEWSRFLREQDFEVEGMFYHEQDLFIGLKKPLKDHKAVILRIKDIEKVLSEGRIRPENVGIWRELELGDEVLGKAAGISDMILHKNCLYVLCSARHDHTMLGSLQVYDMEGNKIQTEYFEDLKPEGIVPFYGKGGRENLVITFDEDGKRSSKMLRLEGLK